MAAIYEKGEIVEKDIEESERLRRMLVTKFQKSDDGLEWRIRLSSSEEMEDDQLQLEQRLHVKNTRALSVSDFRGRS